MVPLNELDEGIGYLAVTGETVLAAGDEPQKLGVVTRLTDLTRDTKRLLAEQHLIEHDANGEDVASPVQPLARGLFGASG